MRNLRRALLASGFGFAVSFLASCGGGAGLLSGDQANTLNNQLNQVSAALAAGHCRAVRSATHSLAVEVANLPSTISGTLRQDLDAGVNTVSQLATRQCRPVSSTTTATTQPTTTATTTPTTTATTPPATTQTTTTTPPITTTSATTTTGSSGGGGLGNGGGVGQGNGGGTGGGATGGALSGGGGG